MAQKNIMSNLLKSKIVLGFMVLAILVGVTAFAAPTKAACDLGTITLKQGQRSAAVTCLQASLGMSQQTGYFGTLTLAAVKAFQANHGLTADGKVGAMTKVAITGAAPVVTNYPAGCTSAVGFSATTGLPCNGTVVTTLPAGCAVGALFSSTTGLPCTGTVVTPSGTNGYLADLAQDSTNRVSTVYESEQNQVVAGFRATARLADQTVDRVRVTFYNNGTGSTNLSKYITGASLWNGSTKIATMPVAMADRGTSSDIYTFNFSGLNTKVLKDQIGRFYVSVDAVGSLDTANTGAGSNFTVTFVDGGISASSPDGSYDTYSVSPNNITSLSFGKFSSNGVKATVGLSSGNPASSVVTVQNTAPTNAVDLLKFTIKATNSDLTLRKIPIQVVSTGNNISTMINTIKLYNGTNLVDTVDGSALYDVSGAGTTINQADTALASGLAGGYVFANLSSPYNVITAGSTAEFTVVVDLKQVSGNYAEGNTLTASFTNGDALLTANFSVNDVNGDQLLAGSTYRIGSAIGQIQTLRINGVNVVMGTPTYVTSSRGGTGAGSADVVDAIYTIPLTVTSFGQTLYAGQIATNAATTPGTTGAGAVAVAYGFNKSTAPGTLTSYSAPDVNITVGGATLSSTDATIENLAYRLDAGNAKHFVLTVELNSIGATAGAAKSNIRVALQKFATWTDNALSAGQAIQTLLPIQSYQTGYVGITAN